MTNTELQNAIEAIEQLMAEREAAIKAAPNHEKEAAEKRVWLTMDEAKAMYADLRTALNAEVTAMKGEYLDFVEAVAPMVHAYESDVLKADKAAQKLALLAGDPVMQKKFVKVDNGSINDSGAGKWSGIRSVSKTGSYAYRTINGIVFAWERKMDGMNK